MEMLNVYFYAFYCAENKPRANSGLVADESAEQVREDIMSNFRFPRFITVRQVPELAGVVCRDSTRIMTHNEARAYIAAHTDKQD